MFPRHEQFELVWSTIAAGLFFRSEGRCRTIIRNPFSFLVVTFYGLKILLTIISDLGAYEYAYHQLLDVLDNVRKCNVINHILDITSIYRAPKDLISKHEIGSICFHNIGSLNRMEHHTVVLIFSITRAVPWKILVMA